MQNRINYANIIFSYFYNTRLNVQGRNKEVFKSRKELSKLLNKLSQHPVRFPSTLVQQICFNMFKTHKKKLHL